MSKNTSPHPDPFTDQAHSWWEQDGPFWTLHRLNPIRLQFITEHLKLHKTIGLDIGCGGGLLTEALHHEGAIVSGIDASESAVSVAKAHAIKSKTNISYTHSTAEDYLEATKKDHDFITCLELLEHVENPQAILQLCSQRLKPGGWLFVSTLNRTIRSFLLGIIGAEYILNWVPKGTHQYHQFIQPAEMIRWARENQLHPKTLSGVTVKPLTKEFSRSSDTSINYMIAFQKEVL